MGRAWAAPVPCFFCFTAPVGDAGDDEPIADAVDDSTYARQTRCIRAGRAFAFVLIMSPWPFKCLWALCLLSAYGPCAF